ncbi:hypothetical protein ACFFSP_04760 [Persicitalea jodogahamensis]
MNKNITIQLLSLLMVLIVGTSGTLLAQGIQFQEKDIDQLAVEAKKQGKLVFVEMYLKGCPHCEALAPVLEENKVGEFFNPKFVSAKYEANAPLSKALQEKKKLHYPEFPLFFFFNADGELIHQASPSDKPTRPEFIEEVIRHANEALSPATRTSSYATRYQNGERNLDFLINYAKYAKTTRDTAQSIALATEFGKIFVRPDDLESTYGFYVISRFINDFQNPMAQYFFQHLDTYRSRHGARPAQDAGENILFQSLYGKGSDKLSSKEITAMRQALESLGVAPNIASMRTILKELEAYFREKNTAAATARFDEYQAGNLLRTTDYAYLMRFFNDKAPDPAYAEKLIGWTDKAIKAVNTYDQNKPEVAELYREQSEAYFRLGKKEEGKKAAEKALAIAKLAKDKPDSYEKQLAKFSN